MNEAGLSIWQWIYRAVILVAGWVFFIWSNPSAIIWLIGITLLGYGLGLTISERADRRFYLAAGVAGIVVILCFFKYGDIITGHSFVIPLGLSYYSLMVIGYIIDIYRGDIQAEKNILIFALYVGFFPQVTAGPIGRASDLLSQYKKRITVSTVDIKAGFFMIMLGVFEKWVLADNLRVITDSIVNAGMGGISLAFAFIIFSLVIYYDFAGYSLIAIGLSRLLGIKLMDNFHSPYLACSVKDFWRRWHISLSSWFRDYLYIPLGGSRVPAWRRDINTVIVFTVSGAWHGQALGFWLWGLLHGAYLVIENRLRSLFGGIKIQARVLKEVLKMLGRILVFILVSFAWIPFYAGGISKTTELYTRLFTGSSAGFMELYNNSFGYASGTMPVLILGIIVFLIISIICEKYRYTWYTKIARHGVFIFISGLILYTLLLLVGAYGSNYDPAAFIYGGF